MVELVQSLNTNGQFPYNNAQENLIPNNYALVNEIRMLYNQLSCQSKMCYDKDMQIQELEKQNQFLKDGVYGNDIQLLEESTKKVTMLFKNNQYYQFLEAIISDVIVFNMDLKDKKMNLYIVTFKKNTNEMVTLSFLETELQSTKIFFNKMEQAGLHVMVKFSNAEKLQLLKRQIYSKQDATCTLYVPYKAGWKEKRYFCSTKGISEIVCNKISSPFLKRHFMESNLNLKDNLKYFSKALSNPENLLLFVIMAGALIYTPLKEAGFKPTTLFMLDTELETTYDIINLFQLWTDEKFVKIEKPKSLSTSLAEYKDEAVVIIDDDSNYSLKICHDLDIILQNGKIINEETTEEFNAVPILITSRSNIWTKKCKKVLFLPSPDCCIHIDIIRLFWKNFCNTLSQNYENWTEKIGIKYSASIDLQKYTPELKWIMESYNIFLYYLQCLPLKDVCSNYKEVSIQGFLNYLYPWFLDIERMENMNISEAFIEKLQKMKASQTITFIKPCHYDNLKQDTSIIAVDDTYLYIPDIVMTTVSQSIFSKASVKEIYAALVEDGYAKGGDGNHVYPKVPSSAGFKTRIRMAQVERELLLSDAEINLEDIR